MRGQSKRQWQQHLAGLIFQHLPIEFLPPAQRRVADISIDDDVSMLLAGFERLIAAPDDNPLETSFHGIASDISTAQRKSELTHTWREQIIIDEAQLLNWEWLAAQPYLVVGTISPVGVDLFEAQRHLSHILKCVAVGGYIGLVLPKSLLCGCTWEVLRQTIFSEYDLLELWTVPDDLLANEIQPLVVVLAQRCEGVASLEPILVRHIPSLEQMPLSTGMEIWDGVPTGLLFNANDWLEWRDGRLLHQLPEAERVWMTHELGWTTTGVVDHVTALPPSITFWMEGFEDETEKWPTVPVVSSMPGWLLRSGAAFWTRFPRKYRRQRAFAEGTRAWEYFRAQAYMYLSEEELLGGISRHFSREDE